MFKKICAFLLFLSLPFTSLSASKVDKNEWHLKTEPPYFIYYHAKDISSAEFVLKILPAAHRKLTTDFQIQLTDSITFFLTPSQKVFQHLVGKHIPKWSNGVAAPYSNVIVLKALSWVPPETDHRAIIYHELTHLFVNEAAHGQHVPRWLNEGLAVFYSGEKAFASGSLISKALITKSLIDLSDIDDVLEFHQDKARLAYQQSYLAVVYLLDNYEMSKVREILTKISQGKNSNEAFLEVLGTDLWDFEDEWLAYVQKKYRWNFLIDFDTYFWIFLVLLFILVFLFIKRRNRKTVQRWESENSDLEW